MLLRRVNRALRRLPLWLVLSVATAFTLEAFLHHWRYNPPPPQVDLDKPFFTSCQEPDVDGKREDAVLIMLARNKELHKAKKSIRSIESHFNQWFNYPYLFLNDEPWDEKFITEMNRTANGKATFEVVPKDQWTYPDWIDQDRAKKSIKAQGEAHIPHAGEEGYHHMCRFYSGKFYQLDALKQYKWYWRLEPDAEFTCAITYDPFVQMAKHSKVYGYTIALWEVGRSCPSLFRATEDYKKMMGLPDLGGWRAMLEASWAPWPFRRFLAWLAHRDSSGDVWSMCHFWSNFEIADLDFFRSSRYQRYFEYLDAQGGFYSERWGDAAVHSLAVGMLAKPEQLHHFEDFGYRHANFWQCPANAPNGQLPESTLLNENKKKYSDEIKGGIGCRCECNGKRTRNHSPYCLDKLKRPVTAKKGWFS
ncbi:glycolipid 2-alpha-mannosyltransferase [Xylariaceae sp. FL1019]|nr:glycolipid 2-alpha-mannosyltransferase [Xylariaceae sp. FL1019]